MATRYRATAAVRPRALGITALVGLVAGCALAGAWHALDRAFELAVVAPALVGLGAGAAVASAVRRTRLARPALAACLAASVAGIALAGHLALRYVQYRDQHVAALQDSRDLRISVGLPVAEAEEVYRQQRSEITAGAFLRHRFGLGPDLHPASGLPASIGAGGTLAIYAVEVLLALGLAALWARGAAAEPVCPRCGAWRVERLLGKAAHGSGAAFIDGLRGGAGAGPAATLRPPDTREHLRMALLSCPRGHDGGAGVLRVVEHRLDLRRRVQVRRLADLCVSDEELDALHRALASEAG